MAWTDQLMDSSGINETVTGGGNAMPLASWPDIGWRTHPDYRGEQSLNLISHADFVSLDHSGRAYLALSVYFRHIGITHDDELSPRLRELASTRILDRARVLVRRCALPTWCLGVDAGRIAENAAEGHAWQTDFAPAGSFRRAEW